MRLCQSVSESAAEEYIKSYVAGLFKTARQVPATSHALSVRRKFLMGRYPRLKQKRLGEKLLQVRKAFGLSQTEMLRRLGFEKELTRTNISTYETATASRRCTCCFAMLLSQEFVRIC
jgi:hypothetical protein